MHSPNILQSVRLLGQPVPNIHIPLGLRLLYKAMDITQAIQ